MGDQLTLSAPTWAACDLSAGGSIYVPNKQELMFSAFQSAKSRSLAKTKGRSVCDIFVAETQNVICDGETSNQMKMVGV